MLDLSTIKCACGTPISVSPAQMGASVVCETCSGTVSVTPGSINHAPLLTHDKNNEASQVGPIQWKAGDVVLDLYEIKGILGHGGMGTVYRVYHRGWNTELAVKSPKPTVLAAIGGRSQFEAECEAWVQLGLHPNIVTCYYVRRIGGIPRVFAELVDGKTVHDLLDDKSLYQGGPTRALRRILSISIQMAWGLAHAHSEGLVHRDVKSSNVLFRKDGTLKVTDFGLAKIIRTDFDSAAGLNPSHATTRGGLTPVFCSPEQAFGDPVTNATDLWSWGLTVLHMYAGKVFWALGTSALAELHHYSKSGLPKHIPKMPTAIFDLLERCFQTDPRDRPPGMEALSQLVLEVYEHEIGEPYPFTLPRQQTRPTDRQNNRGVSLIDLGRTKRAERVLKRAYADAPGHVDVGFNLGLLRWRQAAISDRDFIVHLETLDSALRNDSRLRTLLASAHLERGDFDAGKKVIDRIPPERRNSQSIHSMTESMRLLDQRKRCLLSDLPAHADAVRAVAIDFEGGIAISAGDDKLIRVHHPVSRREIAVFRGHRKAVNSIQLLFRGASALSASRDGSLMLWKTRDAQLEWAYQAGETDVLSARATIDGRFIAWSNDFGQAQVYDRVQAKVVFDAKAHKSAAHAIDINSNGAFVVTAGEEGAINFFELTSGTRLQTFLGHVGAVKCVVLRGDCSYIVSGGADGTIRIWDLRKRTCIRTIHAHDGGVNAIAISASQHRGISVGNDRTVRIWDFRSGRCLTTFHAGQGPLFAVGLTPDGTHAITGGADGVPRLWRMSIDRVFPPAPFVLCRAKTAEESASDDARLHECLDQAARAYDNADYLACLSHVRKARAVPGYGHHVRTLAWWTKLYPHLNKQTIQAVWPSSQIRSDACHIVTLATSTNQHNFVSGERAGLIRVWNSRTAECVRVVARHTKPITAISVASQAGCLVAADEDGLFTLWNISGAQRPMGSGDSRGAVEALAIDASATRIATAGWAFAIWDFKRGGTRTVMHQDAGFTNAVVWSNDGRHILSGDSDGQLRIWNAEDGRKIAAHRLLHAPIRCMQVSPDGRYLAVGGGNPWADSGHTCVWDLASDKLIVKFDRHRRQVNAVAITSDGRFVISGAEDGSLALWSSADGQLVYALRHKGSPIKHIAIGGHDAYIVVSDASGYVQTWLLEWALS